MQRGKFDIHIKDFLLFRESTDETDVIIEEISKIMAGRKIESFLDIGCGSGELTGRIVKKFGIKNSVAIDTKVFSGKLNKGIKFLKKDWLNFTSGQKFDFILSSHSTAYLSYRNASLSFEKIYDYLKDNGLAIIIIYNNKGAWTAFKSIFYPAYKSKKCTLDFVRPIINKYAHSEKTFFTRIYAKSLGDIIKIGRFLGEKYLDRYLRNKERISKFFMGFQKKNKTIVFPLEHKLFVMYKNKFK
jgi:SAM-dependent methyltransferase